MAKGSKREIKFRAWHKREEEFYLDFTLGGLSYQSDGGTITVGEGNPWEDMVFIEDLEFTQYTGLKDKNGKEIYEGDIVVNGTDRYIVEFRNGGFNLAGIEDFTHDTYIWFEYDRVEVVGNIYENSNLLKEK